MKRTKNYPDLGEVTYYARRQKNLRLSLRAHQIIVSYPYFVSFKRAEAFLLQRKKWILKHHSNAPRLCDQQKIGRHHRLSWQKGLQQAELKDQIIYADPNDKEGLEALIKEVLKIEATEFILPRVNSLSQEMGLEPERVRFRYMKTRWGSCSSRRSLNLNSALVYLPQELIDYVITHELCHLKHLNHSPAFWAMVANHRPNYQNEERKLRAYKIYFVIKEPQPEPPSIDCWVKIY